MKFCEWWVWFQCITQWCCTCVFNGVVCWFDVTRREWIVARFHLCFVCFAFTTQIEFHECCVWFQRITQWCYSSFSNLAPCIIRWKKKKRIDDGCHLCIASVFFTTEIEFCERCVWFQCITQWCCSCVSNLVSCRFNEIVVADGRYCCAVRLCSPYR